MSGIVLLSSSPELVERVHWATSGRAAVVGGGAIPTGAAELRAQLGGAPLPSVLVLDAAGQVERALELAGQLSLQGVGVVLVTDQGAQVGLAALRAGVRDIIEPSAEVGEIGSVLVRVEQEARARVAESSAEPADLPGPQGSGGGRLITVTSPKGGVGKTTLSTNLAVGLALAGNSTALVDLDIQFGDVASGLGLDPEYTLVDFLQGATSTDTMALKTYLTRHKSGLFVVCAPLTPADAEGITGDEVSQLLATLTSVFAFVVVDTAPGLSEHTLAALDHTTDVLLVTSMDVPGVRGLKKELETLIELGMVAIDQPTVVLNFADPSGGLSVADVQATIGRRVDQSLPVSRSVTGSVNQGVPLLEQGGRDPMAKQLRLLVERYDPTANPDGKSRLSRGRHRRLRGGARR